MVNEMKCDEIKALINAATLAELQANKEIVNHTKTCTKCESYLETKQADKAIEVLSTQQFSSSKKNQLLESVKKISKESAKQLKIALLGLVVSVFALVWFVNLGDIELAGAIILSAWIIGSAVYSSYLARKKNRVEHSLIELDTSLFEHCRKDITFKIRVIKILGSILMFEAIVLIVAILVKGITVSSGLPIFIGLSAIFSFFVAYQFLVVMPRLTNELKLLNEAT
jgi:hypothetical protein